MRILIPTDLSEGSAHAIRYAASLVETLNAELILLHTWTITPPYPEFGEYVAAMDAGYFAAQAAEKTREFIKGLHNDYPIFGTPLVHEGFAPETIIGVMKELKPDLTIMGRRALSPAGRAVLGSITAAVVKKATCPVLIVPEKTPVTALKEVAFATDFHDNDLASLQLLLKIVKPHGSHLRVVHFNTPGPDHGSDPQLFADHEQRIRMHLRYAGLEFEAVACQNLQEGLDSYMAEKHVQLLALADTRRSRWQLLFEPSVTTHALHHFETPLLVFQARDGEGDF